MIKPRNAAAVVKTAPAAPAAEPKVIVRKPLVKPGTKSGPPPAAKPTTKATAAAAPKVSTHLTVFDIGLDNLVGHNDNPNEQDERTFDQLVDGMRTYGCDEPIIVVPIAAQPGKYLIVSGHHRTKAARVLEWETIPCVIKQGWDQDRADIELVRRNMLKGSMNPEKFTQLFDKVKKKGYDTEQLKLLMGFTKADAFKKMYKQVADSLPPQAKAKLEEAKETVRTVDDLSSVLNRIFREGGSELDAGYMVFSFGGKNHHYFIIDDHLDKSLTAFQKKCTAKSVNPTEWFKRALLSVEVG